MSTALAGRVEGALGSVDETARTALRLREREEADYRTIAAQLDVGREGVADLLVSARLGVWSAMHEEAPPPRRTPQCGPARRVLAAQADGEAVSAADAERAREHLAGCPPCQSARLALREAELACRAWRSDPAPAVPEPGPTGARLAAAGPRGARLPAGRRRLAAAAVVLVLLIAILAAVIGGDDAPPPPGPPAAGPGSAEVQGATEVVPPPGDRFCPAEDPDCK